MSQQWFTSRGGQESGPFPPAELKRLADAGQLLPTDLVRRADKSEWVPASSVRGLFGQPPSADAPPSTAPKSSAKPPPFPASRNTNPPSLPSSESSSSPEDAVDEDRTDDHKARKPATSRRKFERSWKRLSPGAKAGIIGGGCGGLLFLFTLCAGVASLLVPARKDAFLPHKPGTSREYVHVVYAGDGDTVATLWKYSYKENGTIEKVITKVGKLEGKKELLDGGKVKWGKSVNITSDFPEHHRLNGDFIEIGSHLSEDDKITWEPRLKVGAKPKDTWTWEPMKSMTHHYTVTEEKTWKGKSAIIVREEASMGNGAVAVIFHTYVRYVGLVESCSRVIDPNHIRKMGYDLKLADE